MRKCYPMEAAGSRLVVVIAMLEEEARTITLERDHGGTSLIAVHGMQDKAILGDGEGTNQIEGCIIWSSTHITVFRLYISLLAEAVSNGSSANGMHVIDRSAKQLRFLPFLKETYLTERSRSVVTDQATQRMISFESSDSASCQILSLQQYKTESTSTAT